MVADRPVSLEMIRTRKLWPVSPVQISQSPACSNILWLYLRFSQWFDHAGSLNLADPTAETLHGDEYTWKFDIDHLILF